MMKKSTLLTMVIFMIAMLIYSCDKDEFSEEDAYKYEQDLKAMEAELAMEMEEARLEWLQDSLAYVRMRDSLERIGGIINYAVNVVSGGDAGFTKAGSKEAEWLHGTVTINQHGHRVTQEIGLDGIAVFEDLRIGLVTVSIQCPGYTTVDYEAVLNPDWTMEDVYLSDAVGAIDKCCEDDYSDENNEVIPLDDEYYGIKRNATTMVPVFPMEGQSMSTIKGQVTWETNLTNCAPETAQGVRIIGMIDTESDDFKAKYMRPTSGMLAYSTDCMDCLYGQIVNIIYGGVVARGTEEDPWASVTDNDGLYTLRVPSTATGLPIKLTVSEVAADQYLLVNTLYGEEVFGSGVQKVRAIFSSEIDSAAVSPIPMVPPAFAVFEAPKTDGAEEPAVEAKATAVIAKSGIDYVHVQEHGGCYTQAPEVIIKQRTCGQCNTWNTSAKANAVMIDGEVYGIDVEDPGKGYYHTTEGMDSIDVILKSKPELMGTKANLLPVITYSLDSVNLKDTIRGFDSKPYVLFNADAGEGAVLEPVMKQYIDTIIVTNSGFGYTEVPDVLVNTGGSEKSIAATAHMSSEDNPIYSIDIIPGNSLMNEIFADPPTFYIYTENGEDNGAKAVGHLKETGGVLEIEVRNGGWGYKDSAGVEPTIEITDPVGDGNGAHAHAVVDDMGRIERIVVSDEGVNYKAIKVHISAPVDPDGVQADAIGILGRKIDRVEVTDNGSGYNKDDVVVEIEGLGDDDYADSLEIGYLMRLESISLGVGGNIGFESKPQIRIEGTGKNATAEASMKWAITDIKVIDGGHGYRNEDDDPNQKIVVQDYGVLGTGEVSTVMSNGQLSKIIIDNAGDNYTAPPHVMLKYSGQATDTLPAVNQELFLRDFEIMTSVRNGKIISYEVHDPGVNLRNASIDSFELVVSTYCEEAVASASAYKNAGQISEIIINNPGAGYVVTPQVQIIPQHQSQTGNSGDTDSQGAGWGAKAHAVVVDGRVASIEIDNPGYGYILEPTIQIYVPSYTEQAVGIPFVSDRGTIDSVSFDAKAGEFNGMLTQGQGYDHTNPPSVTFYPTFPGQGKGAKGRCVVEDGKIVDVIMIDRGEGYLGRNYCHNIPLVTDPEDASDDLEVVGNDDVNPGVPVMFMPMYNDWYGHDDDLNGADESNRQGLKMQTEAGKAYIKDIYLGTGLRKM